MGQEYTRRDYSVIPGREHLDGDGCLSAVRTHSQPVVDMGEERDKLVEMHD